MITTKNTHKKQHASRMIPAISLIALLIFIAFGYLIYSLSQQSAHNDQLQLPDNTLDDSLTKNETLTNDQIFDEVASQFGLERDKVSYFRIFGQDKVQYSNSIKGTTFAYKTSGTWKIAQKDSQTIAICSDLIDTPEEYRPPCSDSHSTSSTRHYIDPSGRSTNYPPSSMIQFIGQ